MKLVSRNPEGFDGNSAGQQAKAGIYGSQAWQNQQIIRATVIWSQAFSCRLKKLCDKMESQKDL